jgi:uncharacterized protein
MPGKAYNNPQQSLPLVAVAATAASNLKKHGVSFEEAQSVFYDEFAIRFFDEGGSESEDRFLMLGMSN